MLSNLKEVNGILNLRIIIIEPLILLIQEFMFIYQVKGLDTIYSNGYSDEKKGTKVKFASYYEYPIVIGDPDTYINGYSTYAGTFAIF